MRFLLLAFVCAGCSYATSRQAIAAAKPDLSRLQAGQFDADASESTLVGAPEGVKPGSGFDEMMRKSRKEFADLLTSVLAGRGPPVPARYRATIASEVNITPMFVPCFLVLALLDCPVAKLNLHLDLDLQIGDRLYSGSGDGSSWMFLYGADEKAGDHDLSTEAEGRAVADALNHMRDRGTAP